MEKIATSMPAIELPPSCVDFNKLHDALGKKGADADKALAAAIVIPEGEVPTEPEAEKPAEPVADKA